MHAPLSAASDASSASDPPVRPARLALVLVFASFLAFSAVRTPVPGVNEPHYFAKAKHYWNPDWCAGDLFLESFNAHVVFYQTVGLLTRWLTLEQAAWTGRAAALALLALGWTRLVSSIVPGRWSPVWAAGCYLALAALADWSKRWTLPWGEESIPAKIFELSGEWLVGGVEAKVFAYAFLFWGLALLGERRGNAAAVCGGLAVSFHPVVGIWGVTAAVAAFAIPSILRFGARSAHGEPGTSSRTAHPPLKIHALLLLAAFSLPGLLPALKLIGEGEPSASLHGDYIQVFHRLAHHLDPMRFPVTAFLSFGALAAFWLVARRRAVFSVREGAFARFVLAAVLIAAVGFAAGAGPRPAREMPGFALRMKVLKFYPFRLADLLVPVAASMTLVALAAGRSPDRHPDPRAVPVRDPARAEEPRPGTGGTLLCWTTFAAAAVWALAAPVTDRDPSRMTPAQRDDWIAMCRWMAAETPADALVLTATRSNWAFKWYAGRAEYVAYKDCPQDAAGIVEWNRRLRFVSNWARGRYDPERGYSEAALAALRSEGITHLVVDWPARSERAPVYRNATYRVFRLE